MLLLVSLVSGMVRAISAARSIFRRAYSTDDEAGVRVAMKTLLESLGCRVTLAACTDEAMRLASLDPPDVVLADFRLRGEESGIKAIRKLRQQQPDLPAMLISGDTAQDRLIEAQQAGLRMLWKGGNAVDAAVATACPSSSLSRATTSRSAWNQCAASATVSSSTSATEN